MNKYKPLLFAVLFIAAVAGIAYCNRKPKPEPTPAPANSEANRTRQQQADSIAHRKYLQTIEQQQAKIKALEQRLLTATSKDKAATTKARQSAKEYEKTPTLDNCHHALKDCQEENETKAFALAVQEQMIAAQDSAIKTHVSEIARQVSVIDSAFTGWGKANTGWAEAEERAQKWEKKARRRGKIITIGAAIVAAVVGVALSR